MLKTCEQCGGVFRPESACPGCATTPRSRPLVKAAVVLGLSLAGCKSDGGAVALYGVPDSGFIDEDNDGIRRMDDCDDTDPERFPGNPETPGDGIDSNCNDDDDT